MSVGQNTEKLELSRVARGVRKGASPRDLASPLPEARPEALKMRMQARIRMPVFTAASPATAKWWEQPECPSTDEWINECGVYVQCSIIQPYKKKKKRWHSVLTHATTWMNRKNIILNEMAQKQQDRWCTLALL